MAERTVQCVRCAARGQLEPWADSADWTVLPYGWHFSVGSNDVLCPPCWMAGITGMLETAKLALSAPD